MPVDIEEEIGPDIDLPEEEKEEGFEGLGIDADVGIISLSAELDGSVEIEVEVPTPVPGITVIGGFQVNVLTGEFEDFSGGLGFGNISELTVTIDGCNGTATFSVKLPILNLKTEKKEESPFGISYSIEFEIPNCKKPEQEEPETPLPPPEDPGGQLDTIWPPGFDDNEMVLVLLNREGASGRTETYTSYSGGKVISSATGSTSRTWSYQATLDKFIDGKYLGSARGEAIASFDWSFKFSNQWDANYAQFNRLSGTGNSGQTDSQSPSYLAYGDESNINDYYWAYFGTGAANDLGIAAYGKYGFIKSLFSKSVYERSAVQPVILTNGTNYSWTRFFSVQWKPKVYRAPYIKEPKFEKSNIPPIPPQKTMKNDECCKANTRLTREIHEALNVKELLSKGFSIPEFMPFPGESRKPYKMKNYLELFKASYLQADKNRFKPFKLIINDTNAGKAGNQRLELQVNDISGALKTLLELLIDTEADGDMHTNLLVRLAYTCTQILQVVVAIEQIARNIEEFLAYRVKQVKTKLRAMFDPFAGTKNNKKKKLDKNEEQSTESLLPELCKETELEVPCTENIEKKDLSERLLEIFNVVQSSSRGRRL